MYAKRAVQLKLVETFKVAHISHGDWENKFGIYVSLFRDIFELSHKDNRNFVETTKTQVLEGTSKWSAKVAIRGL